jgi:hypothetical protein
MKFRGERWCAELVDRDEVAAVYDLVAEASYERVVPLTYRRGRFVRRAAQRRRG